GGRVEREVDGAGDLLVGSGKTEFPAVQDGFTTVDFEAGYLRGQGSRKEEKNDKSAVHGSAGERSVGFGTALAQGEAFRFPETGSNRHPVHAVLSIEVEFGERNAEGVGCFSDYLASRIDNAAWPFLIHGGDHVKAVVDCARSGDGIPMARLPFAHHRKEQDLS